MVLLMSEVEGLHELAQQVGMVPHAEPEDRPGNYKADWAHVFHTFPHVGFVYIVVSIPVLRAV